MGNENFIPLLYSRQNTRQVQSGNLRDTEQIVGVSWFPEKPGLYSFRSFAVSSIDNPEFAERAGSLNLLVVEAGEPITVGTGSSVYSSLDYVDVIGRITGQNASTKILKALAFSQPITSQLSNSS